MFSCSACFRRALTALLRDVPPPTTSVFSRKPNPKTLPHGARHHATVQSLRKGHHLRVLRDTLQSNDPIPLKRKTLRKGPSASTRRNNRARERNGSILDLEPSASTTGDPRSGESKEKYALQFLKDPLKLASTVLGRLRGGDVSGALALVRASDREMTSSENIVSWNHVMDYEMSYENVKGALKVYNEMKKRGHKPDAHTYTIMLRGFTANIRKPQAVQNALSVYNSMFAPNSAVTPNIIHTNAIINVCARGKDMDALWSVAGRLPERGPGAPDKWTFTTILNALASNAQTKASQYQQVQTGRVPGDNGDYDEHARKVFDEAVGDGRKLWGDVVGRWRKGDLMVDQPLVCAMGRLLLLGSRRSGWEDVFGLVEQTMNIPRWTPGGEEQKTLPPPESEFEPVEISFPAGDGKGGETGAGKVGTSVYAQPGNNALSMLMQAAIMTKNVPAGKMYWDLLTDTNGPYKLEPDAANLASYLRLLRISRSSKVVVDLLRSELLTTSESLGNDFYKRGTFVIAMSTCVRDKNNPNVFEHANRVVDVMQERLEEMDPKVMGMYINLAVLTTPGVSSVSPLREQEFEKDGSKNNAMRALKRLGPSVVNVKDLIKKRVLEEEMQSGRGKGKGRPGLERIGGGGPSVDDLAAFLQSMVGAYDRLLAKGAGAGVERALLEEWLGQKRKLSAFVTKMIGGVKSTGRGRRFGDGDMDREDGEVDVERAENEMRDKRWERNPGQAKKGPLTKQEQRVERMKRDFPDPRAMKKQQQQETEMQRGEGAVVKGWGAAFGEMEKGQGKSHGMAL